MGRLIEVGLALVIAILLLAPFSSRADSLIMEDRSTGEFIVLHTKKCTDPDIAKIIPAEAIAQFYNGEAFIQKKMWQLCWTLMPDASVLFVFPDGDIGRLPVSAFRKMSSV